MYYNDGISRISSERIIVEQKRMKVKVIPHAPVASKIKKKYKKKHSKSCSWFSINDFLCVNIKQNSKQSLFDFAIKCEFQFKRAQFY